MKTNSERDHNNYLVVKKGTRKFYITPYESFYTVRDTKGVIQRLADGRRAFVQTEDQAVRLVETVEFV
jgi:hypothetical protein